MEGRPPIHIPGYATAYISAHDPKSGRYRPAFVAIPAAKKADVI